MLINKWNSNVTGLCGAHDYYTTPHATSPCTAPVLNSHWAMAFVVATLGGMAAAVAVRSARPTVSAPAALVAQHAAGALRAGAVSAPLTHARLVARPPDAPALATGRAPSSVRSVVQVQRASVAAAPPQPVLRRGTEFVSRGHGPRGFVLCFLVSAAAMGAAFALWIRRPRPRGALVQCPIAAAPGAIPGTVAIFTVVGQKAEAPAPVRVPVVTYNVLSSHLADPRRFRACDPECLEEHVRYERLLLQLRPHMRDRSIICLQEVSGVWAGRLHPFFQRMGYYFIHHPYGYAKNGYMGCGVAFPLDSYDLKTCATPKISEAKWWPPRARRPGPVRRVWNFVTGWFRRPDPAQATWDVARSRHNTLVFVRLTDKATQTDICVGTYHMPCVFWDPQVMNIHAALSGQQVQELAAGDPYVFCGDFNLKPGDAAYQLLLDGCLPPDDVPVLPPGDEWVPALPRPMQSAYKEVNGQEPDFTNYAKVNDDPAFIETLDYLFYGNGLRAEACVPTPHRSDVQGPFPTEAEPSDHILLGATFEA